MRVNKGKCLSPKRPLDYFFHPAPHVGELRLYRMPHIFYMVSIFLKIGKGTLSLIDPHRHMSVGGATDGQSTGPGAAPDGKIIRKGSAPCGQPLAYGAEAAPA